MRAHGGGEEAGKRADPEAVPPRFYSDMAEEGPYTTRVGGADQMGLRVRGESDVGCVEPEQQRLLWARSTILGVSSDAVHLQESRYLDH